MMSLDIQAAVSMLQQHTDVTKTSFDSFELDRTDRALDELVRNPTKSGEPRSLVKSARANALKVVKSRAEHGEFSLDNLDLHAKKREQAELAAAYDVTTEIDILCWLDTTPSVSAPQRGLLKALAAGYDAESLAASTGLPLKRVRERIARARRAASTGYRAEVMCA